MIWISDGQDGSGFGVFGQRYDANSSPVGSEFAVNTTVEGNQGYHDGEYLFGPALTSLATGGSLSHGRVQGQMVQKRYVRSTLIPLHQSLVQKSC